MRFLLRSLVARVVSSVVLIWTLFASASLLTELKFVVDLLVLIASLEQSVWAYAKLVGEYISNLVAGYRAFLDVPFALLEGLLGWTIPQLVRDIAGFVAFSFSRGFRQREAAEMQIVKASRPGSGNEFSTSGTKAARKKIIAELLYKRPILAIFALTDSYATSFHHLLRRFGYYGRERLVISTALGIVISIFVLFGVITLIGIDAVYRSLI